MSKNLKYIVTELLLTIIFFISFELYYNNLIFYFFIFIIIFFILVLYLISILFVRKNKKLNVILKKYSDILVQIDNKYDIYSRSIIFVKKFSNLVVAHQRLGEPILYFYSNNLVNFLVNDDNNILIYILSVNDVN